jgi:TIR domain
MTTRRRIFLAHAWEDKPHVRKLYDDLKARGLDPWLDEKDLKGGQIWKTEIPKAIRQAEVFLACLSKRSVEKRGYVQQELREALSAYGDRPAESIYIIPVRLDECEIQDLQIPDRGLSFRDIHWVDLWQEGGFDRLVADIEYALTVGTPPSQPVSRNAASTSSPAQLPGVRHNKIPILTNTNTFLYQPISTDTLVEYTKRKYPDLPADRKTHELLLRDLSRSGFVTLYDVDRAVDVAANAVECYRRENPGFFRAGTDFLTKSLGFVDKEFRARHPFSQRTRDAFLKYEHLLDSPHARQVHQDQETIANVPEQVVEEDPRERNRQRWGPTLRRHPTIVAVIIGAIGAVAASVSPFVIAMISDGKRPPPETDGDSFVIHKLPPAPITLSASPPISAGLALHDRQVWLDSGRLAGRMPLAT